ncbi:hypothetical protein [Gloeothece verrucosa]|uniref:Uncharacterized protein n=1 Tax=Gloeothece verrucosa (strain PCC 7822) TaxID=497965 RepID=E0U8P7_GLOV7|nr:hypothetical protein [Gloeothece verrucosa]ADN14568.1 hypothetical protein Cyan7822_2597 [Gloeothece verrucosa PCC 7822]ADN14911.1 hypothetical protein Cyan7822_2954 [Gloeothece verrucosa PCC 7822]ADN15231.1 hypothetical protein Cyan7822_3281 [Gloeothece verrucosa PCC 7822]ADN16421.1 hypothetical protein Cyan7822_4511 [Gloeothece verrucosa PCC 7822]
MKTETRLTKTQILFQEIGQEAHQASLKYQQKVTLIAQSVNNLEREERPIVEMLRHHGGELTIGELVFVFSYHRYLIEELLKKGVVVIEE